jgi:excisionase family DNA binding protein
MGTTSNPDFVEAIAARVVEKMRSEIETEGRRSKRLLIAEQSAEYLALSMKSIHEMLTNHKLTGVKFGRKTMLDIRDLDQWIERNKACHTVAPQRLQEIGGTLEAHMKAKNTEHPKERERIN